MPMQVRPPRGPRRASGVEVDGPHAVLVHDLAGVLPQVDDEANLPRLPAQRGRGSEIRKSPRAPSETHVAAQQALGIGLNGPDLRRESMPWAQLDATWRHRQVPSRPCPAGSRHQDPARLWTVLPTGTVRPSPKGLRVNQCMLTILLAHQSRPQTYPKAHATRSPRKTRCARGRLDDRRRAGGFPAPPRARGPTSRWKAAKERVRKMANRRPRTTSVCAARSPPSPAARPPARQLSARTLAWPPPESDHPTAAPWLSAADARRAPPAVDPQHRSPRLSCHAHLPTESSRIPEHLCRL